MRQFQKLLGTVDWTLFAAVLLLSGFGLVTMYSFVGDNSLFHRQMAWLGISVFLFFVALIPDYRFFRVGNTTFYTYLGVVALLVLVLLVGEVVLGAQQRIDLGFFSLQPSDPAKLVLIILLAKYFSKRHELIGDIRHIIVSGLYTVVLVALLVVQPDFGSAAIILFIWFGLVLVAGIKLRHIIAVGTVGLVTLAVMWNFVFYEYQKQRILTFLDPLADVQGAGYNAYQSTVAVGSGELFGKGIGYGTQSKLLFLPEFETDFIFASFAEEWGFAGVLLLFALFGIVIWRLVRYAIMATGNFEALVAAGVAIMLSVHFFVHVGINIGLLPVTGTTIPFLSYGGSHLVTEFVAIALVMAMGKHTNQRQPKISTVPGLIEE